MNLSLIVSNRSDIYLVKVMHLKRTEPNLSPWGQRLVLAQTSMRMPAGKMRDGKIQI